MTTILLASALGAGLLVAPADLARALESDPATLVVAVGDRPADFEAGHIPGARFVRYSHFAVDGPEALGSELPPVADLVAVFGAAGVTDRSRVVLYGPPLAAARAFFTLDYLGHPDVRILNGGLAAWKAEGRRLETGAAWPARPAEAARLTPRPRPEVLAGAEWIAARLESGRMTLVDARPDDEFTGADGGMGGAHVAGHLPGARQLVWTDLTSRDGQYRPDAELKARIEAAGARTGTPVVSYCMIGMRASVVYFVARHLGYTVQMYDGSIVDWGRRGLPVRTGRP